MGESTRECTPVKKNIGKDEKRIPIKKFPTINNSLTTTPIKNPCLTRVITNLNCIEISKNARRC